MWPPEEKQVRIPIPIYLFLESGFELNNRTASAYYIRRGFAEAFSTTSIEYHIVRKVVKYCLAASRRTGLSENIPTPVLQFLHKRPRI